MNFGDAKPQALPRFGSVVQWDNPVQLPLGLATTVRNCRYTAQSVATRWGFTNRLKFGAAGSSVAGIAALRYLAADNSGTENINILAYTQTDGNIWSASPFNQATVTQLSTDALMALANIPRSIGLDPRITQAFNRGYIAQGNLASGTADPLVFDPASGTLDQASDKPFGVPWNPATRYRVGQMVSPSTFQTNGLPAAQGTWVADVTGHLYRVTVAGTSDPTTPPAWPTTTGGVIVSGTVTFQEYTPSAEAGLPDPNAPITPTTAADGASPIIAGATVFVVLTYVSAVGESINELTDTQGNLDTTKVLQFTNTTGAPVDLTVTMPPIPVELAVGGPLGANGATGYNVYAYIVQGTPDVDNYTDGTYYAQVAGTNLAAGATATISTYPTGQALPTVNTAIVSTPGNVDTGVRWMVVLFETRTEYITGIGASSPIRVNVTQSGLQLLVQNIPVGPYNCIRRICAFTVAGASAAGPYTYVDADDVESPGFNQADVKITSTCINDNVTTTASFNFTDTYLPGASDVTNYFNRIEIPYCSDVYFSKTLQQSIYTGVKGFPSGHLVSDYADVEAVRVPGSNVQVSESDGDRTVCWRELRENQISLKENSGHAIVPNSGDPSTWATQAIWRGMGPAGAKACAVAAEDEAEFMVFAHRTGAYRYVGGSPQLITREIQALWDQINWDYGYLIVVSIDEKHREVRFNVPMGASTTRNVTLTVNYYFGWADPVIFAVRSGKLVPNVNGRKWSVDDIAVNEMIYIPQRYDPTHALLAGVDLKNQLIMGGADGAIYTLTEGQYFDQNYALASVGYFSTWQSVVGPNPGLAINQLLGASCSAIGNGFCNVYALDDTDAFYQLSNDARAWFLTAKESQRDFGAVGIQSSRFGVGFDNGGVAGAWFEMHSANLWITPTYMSRLG
jgi:hypothetical protein